MTSPDAEQTGTSAQMLAKIQIAADEVVTRVNEWTDRTSPEDFPEALLITSSELHRELMRFAEDIGALNINPDAGTSAQMLALADYIESRSEVLLSSENDSVIVAALRTAASQDARDDPCPYCGNQMHGAFDCNKCGMGSPGRDALTRDAREALKPFAEIALFVEHTDQRDGEIVHRQYDREGKRVELTKDDFRRAAKVYAEAAALLRAQTSPGVLTGFDAGGKAALINAIDSPTIAALAKIFSPREVVVGNSYSEAVVDVIWPRLAAALAAPQPQAGAGEPVRARLAEYICHRFICASDDCYGCNPGSVALEHADTILRMVATPSPTVAGREIDEAEEQIERLNARVVDLLKEQDALKNALVGIAKFTSGDDFTTTLGAINRLVSIRNTAERVLAAVSGAGESGNG